MDAEDAADVERYIRDKRRAETKNKLNEVAQLCNCIGEIYSKYGRYVDAIQEHTQERQLSEVLNDKIGEAIACRKIGECHCALGQFTEALELQKRHLTLARECGNHLEEQRAWATIGRTYLCQTETRNLQEAAIAGKKAEKAFVKALEMCEKIKSTVKLAEYMAMKGRLYLNLGHVFDARGDVATSADMMKRAVSIAQKFKLEDELYMCNVGLATMYQKNCQYSQALRFLEVALKLADKLRDKVRERELFVQKAKVHVCVGDFLAAKHCLKKAHKLKVDSEISEEVLTKIFQSVNKMQEAVQDIETETEEKKLSKHLEIVADCCAELGNYNEAIENYLKVLQYASLMSSEERAAIYISLGQTYADLQQYDNAILYYKQEVAERKDNFEQSCQTLLNVAELEELKGSKYTEVCKVYMSAFEAAKKAKSPKLQVQTLKSLISLQKACKQTTHLQETEKKLAAVTKKYNLRSSSDSQSDDDSDKLSDKQEDGGNISLSDLTVSDESDGDPGNSLSDVPVGRKKSKLARRNEKGETPLHRACIEGNLKKVKSLISEGHPVNPRDYCGWLPLHEACNHGHTAVVEHLLDCGAWINDRGGDRCGGVTPLIDAANCGNLDVVRLLVDRGANLMAKDDDGNTALDSLQAWYSRTCDMLGARDELDYQTTETLLHNRMGKEKNFSTIVKPKVSSPQKSKSKVLEKKINVRLPDLTDDSDEIEDEVTNTLKATAQDKRKKLNVLKKKREIHFSSTKEKKRSSFDDDCPDMDSLHPGILLSTSSSHIDDAAHFYQSVMDYVGSSAQKRSEIDNNLVQVEDKGHLTSSCLPALVNANEDVGDNWLIDDMKAPKNKRKSAAASKIMSTSSVRASNLNKRSRSAEIKDSFTPFRKKRSMYCAKVDSLKDNTDSIYHPPTVMEASFNDSSNEACPVSSSTESTSGAQKLQGEAEAEFWDSDDEMLSHVDTFCEEPAMDVSARESSPVLLSRVNIPRNNQCDKVNSVESFISHKSADNLAQDMFFSKTSDLLKKIALACQESVAVEPQPLSQALAEDVAEKPSYKNSLRVKVKFGEQTLLIPIQPSDQSKNIAWLTLQAQQRYFNMFLLLPILTFSTQDDTILCPGDTISTVLQDNDILTANVSSWERPRLELRYEQACKLSLSEPNKSVGAALKQCDASGHLELKDLSLGTSGLHPVFQALEGQKTLTELCLSGNRLGDSGLTSLMKVIPSLPVLKVLILDTNNISAEGIQIISLALKSELSLQSLSHLSLAHNCLDDIASETLTALLKNLPELKSLNLSACSFTNKLFTSTFCEALRGCKLEHVSVSENQIKLEGVRALLKSLHTWCLHSLDISHTRSSCDGDLGVELEKFLSDQSCHLEALSVSGCHWSESDVLLLNRLATSCKTLRSLQLSQNQNINNKTLQKLLYLCCGSGLEELVARGCSVTSPLGGEFIDAFKIKMSSSRPLKKFVLSCRTLQPSEASSLCDIWKETWKLQGVMKIIGAAISLTVSS
uniref:Tonsoku-like protein n=1 Tax=Biomphalaria glabrata TaxID=6526 RepID=A0A2C9JSZ2_BIOGL